MRRRVYKRAAAGFARTYSGATVAGRVLTWIVLLADCAVAYWAFSPIFEDLGTYPTGDLTAYTERVDMNTKRMMIGLAIVLASMLALSVVVSLLNWRERRRNRAAIRRLASSQAEMSPSEFRRARQSAIAEGTADSLEFTGVYILHNVTRDMYYVGQSVRVLQRVNQHLTGHGNGDVYADLKYGDKFTIRTISLVDSGYQSLNDLERDMIDAYDANRSGYNRTRGNRA